MIFGILHEQLPLLLCDRVAPEVCEVRHAVPPAKEVNHAALNVDTHLVAASHAWSRAITGYVAPHRHIFAVRDVIHKPLPLMRVMQHGLCRVEVGVDETIVQACECLVFQLDTCGTTSLSPYDPTALRAYGPTASMP